VRGAGSPAPAAITLFGEGKNQQQLMEDFFNSTAKY
jgi:hypothetical protein